MIRKIFTASIALAILAMPFVAVDSTPATAAPLLTEADSPTGDTFSACIAGGGVGDVLMLIDESVSLEDSDSDHARVSSADYFVRNLTEALRETQVELNLAVAGFADQQRMTHDWQPLTPETLDTFVKSIDSFKSRTHGQETDYWMAMDGARSVLAAQAAKRGDQRSCQAVVWFSDGEYYLYEGRNTQTMGSEKPYAPGISLTNLSGTAAALDAGTQDLCRPGGLADQMRASRVWIYGVGLDGNPREPQDFTLMSSVADNSSGGCGEVTDRAVGAFMLASNIDDLLFAFNGIASTGGQPLESTGAICQDVVCEEMPHQFVLDASVTDVQVLASAEVPGLPIFIETPSGEVTEIEPGADEQEIALPGAELTVRSLSQNTHSLTLRAKSAQASSDGWTGQWRLAFVDRTGGSEGKTSRASIRINNPISPTWNSSEAEGLHVSGGDEIAFGLVDGDAHTYDASNLLGTFEYVATLTPPKSEPIELLRATDPAALQELQTLDLPSHTSLGEATLDLSFTLTTASAKTSRGDSVPGTTLSPNVASFPVTLLPPLNYPVIGNRLDFGAVEGEVQATAALSVAGGGCLWVDQQTGVTTTASPEGLGDVTVSAADATSEQNCIDTAGLGSVELNLTAEHQGNGTLVGTVPVMIAAEDGVGEPLLVDVPFTVSITKPLNAVNFWLTLVAAIILAIGVPWLLLVLLKMFVSQVPRKPALAAALITVEASHGVLRRDGGPFSLEVGDQTNLLPLSNRRRFTAHGLEFRVRLGFSPFGTGRIEVTNRDVFTRSDAHPGASRDGLRAVMPVTIHNHFVAVQRGVGEGATQHLLVFIPAAGQVATEQLAESVRQKAPDVFEKLGRSVQEQVAKSGGGQDAPPQASESSFGAAAAPPQSQPSVFSQPAPAAPFGQPTPAPAPPAASPFGTPAAATPPIPQQQPAPQPPFPPGGSQQQGGQPPTAGWSS